MNSAIVKLIRNLINKFVIRVQPYSGHLQGSLHVGSKVHPDRLIIESVAVKLMRLMISQCSSYAIPIHLLKI